jgi:hypothetical protein
MTKDQLKFYVDSRIKKLAEIFYGKGNLPTVARDLFMSFLKDDLDLISLRPTEESVLSVGKELCDRINNELTPNEEQVNPDTLFTYKFERDKQGYSQYTLEIKI